MLVEGTRVVVVVGDDGSARGTVTLEALAEQLASTPARPVGPGDPRLRGGKRLRSGEPTLLPGVGGDHWSDILQPALLDHIKLTLIAVALGFVTSFAAALLAYRNRRLEAPIGVLAAFLYTIPSLALFQLLVPITGLTADGFRSRSSPTRC